MITKQIESSGVLEAKTDDELLAIYRELCGAGAQPCPRAQMVERILIALSTKPPRNLKRTRVLKRPPSQPAAYKDTRGRPHKVFDLPPRPGRKIARPVSLRAKILKILTRPEGATVQEVMAVINRPLKDAYHMIRLLNQDMGYGIREDENGNIRAY